MTTPPRFPDDPTIELSDGEVSEYEARADAIAFTERIEVLFAIAAKLGFVNRLGGSEYRSWAEDWIAAKERLIRREREDLQMKLQLLAPHMTDRRKKSRR